MAPVVAWVANLIVTGMSYVVGLSGAGLTAAVAFSQIAATIIVGYGISAAARVMGLVPKMPGLPSGSLTSGSPLLMSRDAIAARRVIYGRTRLSGTIVFAQTAGAANVTLHLVVALAGHACDAFEHVFFNDEEVVLDGNNNATGNYAGLARVIGHLGADNQAADANLVAECAGYWTANHRLRGITYLYPRLQFDRDKFPGGIPNISAVVRGRPVYDPRSGLTAWSDNPALCIRDYLIHPTFGLAVDAAELDDASFIAAANICDEAVGAEKRYTLNGCFDLTAQPATVIEKMCGSMAGMLVYVGGKWICKAGAHEVPTVTLDENDLRGGIEVQTRASMRDICNGVKGTFSAPEENYQPADFPAVQSAAAVAEDGGIEIWSDEEFAFTTSALMSQRLATIELNRARQDITVTYPAKLTALRVQAGDTVQVTNTRFGWNQKLFLVINLKFAVYDANGAPALGVDLQLVETAAELWEGSQALEYDPAPNTSLGAHLPAGADGLNNATVFIYKRAAAAPALPSVVTTYTFATKVLADLNNGWSQDIPGGSNPLYVSTATASSPGATDQIAAAEWAGAQIMAQDGAKSATVLIYKRSAAAPALPNAQTTYTFATGVLTGLTNGWSQQIPAGTDPIYASIASAFAAGATDTIEANEWAGANILARDGASGPAGKDGAALVWDPNFALGGTGYWDAAFNAWEFSAADGQWSWGAKLTGTPTQMVNRLHFRVVPGERYSIRAHLKGTTSWSRITFFNGADVEFAYIGTPNGLAGWSYVEAMGSVPDGAVWARAEVGGTAGGEQVDAVTVTYIPPGIVYNDPSTTVPPVIIGVAGGGGTRTITLTNQDPAATIKYNVNAGADTTYAAPFVVNTNDVVRAWATRAGFTQAAPGKLTSP